MPMLVRLRGCSKPVPFLDGLPFHFVSRPACPSTPQALLILPFA